MINVTIQLPCSDETNGTQWSVSLEALGRNKKGGDEISYGFVFGTRKTTPTLSPASVEPSNEDFSLGQDPPAPSCSLSSLSLPERRCDAIRADDDCILEACSDTGLYMSDASSALFHLQIRPNILELTRVASLDKQHTFKPALRHYNTPHKYLVHLVCLRPPL